MDVKNLLPGQVIYVDDPKKFVLNQSPPIAHITAAKELHFSSGHRVYGHETVCKNMHGHNYVAYFHVQMKFLSIQEGKEQLDSLGRVMDFHEIKSRIWPWLEENWDHAFIYWEKDVEVKQARYSEALNPLKWYCADFNPTVENMAWFLLKLGNELLADTNIQLQKVVLWETHTCFAEAVIGR